MARVLTCWEMGNGLAYMEGTAATSKTMLKAGHEVMVAGRDLTHAERLLGSKVKYYQAPTQAVRVNAQLPAPMNFADVLINLGFSTPGVVVSRVRAWRNFFDLIKPDVVRCIHAPGALLATRGTPMRSLVGGIGFLVPPPVSPLPLQRTWAKDYKPERMAAREAMVLAGMNQALDAIDAPRVASIGALYGEADARLIYTYPELDDYGPRQDVTYLGNLQVAQGEAPVWPEVPGKRIFAYLELFDAIPGVLQALADTRQPVLVYLAHAPEDLLQRYAGSNLRITGRPLNLVETAARCDLGVSHAGHNIAATLLSAGKAQLCLPAMFPQRVTAEKIASLKVSIVSSMSPERLKPDLARLLQDTELGEQARMVAARIAHFTLEAGSKTFMTVLENVIAAGPRRW